MRIPYKTNEEGSQNSLFGNPADRLAAGPETLRLPDRSGVAVSEDYSVSETSHLTYDPDCCSSSLPAHVILSIVRSEDRTCTAKCLEPDPRRIVAHPSVSLEELHAHIRRDALPAKRRHLLAKRSLSCARGFPSADWRTKNRRTKKMKAPSRLWSLTVLRAGDWVVPPGDLLRRLWPAFCSRPAPTLARGCLSLCPP